MGNGIHHVWSFFGKIRHLPGEGTVAGVHRLQEGTWSRGRHSHQIQKDEDGDKKN